MAEVKIGQVWVDIDPRMGRRKLKVVAIEGDRAVVETASGRKTKILLNRFKPTSTGYRLER